MFPAIPAGSLISSHMYGFIFHFTLDEALHTLIRMKPFNWGIIGPGNIAHAFAKGIEVIEDGRILATASRQKERAEAFNSMYGIERAYGSYQELVADPDLDAIYIATPHRYHFEQAKLALEAGKPVLCEKPLTVNAVQAKELMELAASKGLFLMEALWTRYLPIYAVVRDWLERGAIGEVQHVSSTMGFACPRDTDGRMFNHELAGGALLDLGVYNISTSQWVFRSQPESFKAEVFLGETAVDESTTAALNYGKGRSAQFTSSLLGSLRGDFQITGTKGHILIHPPFWCSTAATIEVEGQEETVKRPLRASGFEYEIEAAMKAIREGALEEPTMSHADILGNLQVMDAIRASAGFRYRFE